MKVVLWIVLGFLVVPMTPAGAADEVRPAPKGSFVVSLDTSKDAREQVLRVTTQIRDCSAPPTVRIVAEWAEPKPRGEASVRVSGLDQVIRTRPGSLRRQSELLDFPRAVRVAGRQRIRATVSASWRFDRDAGSCYLVLPALVSPQSSTSEAARGVSRLRTVASITHFTRRPVRTTVRDHVWTCESTRAGNGCAATLTLASAAATSDEDGPPTASVASLSVLGGAVLAAGALAAARTSRRRSRHRRRDG